MNVSELKLVESVAGGDKAAMRTLYKGYVPRLTRFLYRVTRDNELIQEIINDVMLTVWQGAGGFRKESTVSTWILGIAYRKSLEALRRQRRYGDVIKSLPAQDSDESTSHLTVQRDIDRLLTLLNPEQRAVAELSFDFGYSYPEIAAILDIPVNTVKTRMFYARRVMQTWYKESSEGKP